MNTLMDRHQDRIVGTLECLDRVVIMGTLPGICHAEGMTSFLYSRQIRIFDYTKFAEPLRDQIRENAEHLAREADIEIEFIPKNTFRKEQRIEQILKTKDPHHRGLVHIFSAMEPCSSYKPWHDKQTHKTFLKPDSGTAVR